VDALHCDPWSGALQPIRGRFRRKCLTAKARIRCRPALQSISMKSAVSSLARFISFGPSANGPGEMKWLWYGLVATGNS
jgi:hypothetical protein